MDFENEIVDKSPSPERACFPGYMLYRRLINFIHLMSVEKYWVVYKPPHKLSFGHHTRLVCQEAVLSWLSGPVFWISSFQDKKKEWYQKISSKGRLLSRKKILPITIQRQQTSIWITDRVKKRRYDYVSNEVVKNHIIHFDNHCLLSMRTNCLYENNDNF